jgi:hypothetical protein
LLLGDTRDVFAEKAVSRITSADLVAALVVIEERPRAVRAGKPLTQIRLARMLRSLGIAPRTIRVGDRTPKGYLTYHFREAFARFCFEGASEPQHWGTPLRKYLRRKKSPPDLRALAQAHTVRSIQVLAGIMQAGKSERARVRAAALLLDRGWGKPGRAPGVEGDKGKVSVVVRKVVVPRGD